MNEKIKESYHKLLEGNKLWVQEKMRDDPDFFKRHVIRQTPHVLWIGCSDSRVHPGEITHTEKGEIFVHRNIANLVVHTDLNLMSVLQYAVEVLEVQHVILCGHYGCGGIIASMDNQDRGLVNKWLRNIKEVYAKNQDELKKIQDFNERANRLVELNVIQQVQNLAQTSIIQKAWKKRKVQIHGWIYDMRDGHIKDLNCMMAELNDLDPIFRYDID